MEYRENNLLLDINKMLSERERGYVVAQELNDEFWEELGTHKKRLQEQVDKYDSMKPELIKDELSAESVYEAARNFIDKYKNHFSK